MLSVSALLPLQMHAGCLATASGVCYVNGATCCGCVAVHTTQSLLRILYYCPLFWFVSVQWHYCFI